MTQNGPILFAEADELLVLNLEVLNGVVLLSLILKLDSCLVLSVFHENKALTDPVEFIFQHNYTFEVDLN